MLTRREIIWAGGCVGGSTSSSTGRVNSVVSVSSSSMLYVDLAFVLVLVIATDLFRKGT